MTNDDAALREAMENLGKFLTKAAEYDRNLDKLPIDKNDNKTMLLICLSSAVTATYNILKRVIDRLPPAP